MKFIKCEMIINSYNIRLNLMELSKEAKDKLVHLLRTISNDRFLIIGKSVTWDQVLSDIADTLC